LQATPFCSRRRPFAIRIWYPQDRWIGLLGFRRYGGARVCNPTPKYQMRFTILYCQSSKTEQTRGEQQPTVRTPHLNSLIPARRCDQEPR
jgi:hypothetical protein